MFNAKGHSLLMWTLLFAMVLASVVFFVSPVKRAITSKTMRITDLLLWGMWGDAVRQDGGKNINQNGEAVTVTNSNQQNQVVNNRGQFQTRTIADSNTTSSYSSY